LIFPALLKKTWQGLHRRSFLLLIPVSTLMIFTPLEIVFRPGWDPYQGRYFAPVVALCAPLMAEWFKENGHARVEWLWSGLALLFVAVTLLYNPAKPTLGKLADDFHVWHNDRAIIQTLQRKNDRAVYELIEQSVPAHARLGSYTPFFFMEYPLFGDDTDRPLVTIMSAEQATDPVWLKAHSVDYLLIRNTTIKKDVPANYSIHATIYGWTIYHAATP
jgi:hypothetical protein